MKIFIMSLTYFMIKAPKKLRTYRIYLNIIKAICDNAIVNII